MISKFKNKVILILFLTVICQLVSVILLFAGAGTTGANFLKIGVGARAVGMGEAFVAISDDASAIYWNPGGLGILTKKEFSAMHLNWFEGIKYEGLTYVHPVEKNGTWGIDFKYIHINDLKKTVVNSSSTTGYDELGTFSAYDMIVTVGYGKRVLPNLNLGIGVKYIKEKLDNKDADAIAGDFGLLYELKGGKVGFSIQNFGTRIKFVEENGELPFNTKLGISSNLFHDKVILSLELNQPNNAKSSMNIGTELWLCDFLALRVGYKYKMDEDNDLDINSGVTAGVGFGKKVKTDSGLDYQIDYAFVPYGDFGYTHRVSISIQFGKIINQPIKKEKSIIKEISISETTKPAIEEKIIDQPTEKNEVKNKSLNIAMLDFFRDKSTPVSESRFVSRYFRGEINKSEYLSLLNKDNMNAILKEKNLDFGINNPGKKYLSEAGKVLNVEKIVVGEINVLNNKYVVTVGIIDVNTEVLEYVDTIEYSLSNIDQSMKELSSRLINAMISK